MRREFPKKVKVAAYERANGRCERCTAPLRAGAVQYDHVIPDAMGGEPTLANCECVCRTCHRAKTSGTDLPQIARAKRREAKHIGAVSKRPWHPTLRKRLDGTVVRREP